MARFRTGCRRRDPKATGCRCTGRSNSGELVPPDTLLAEEPPTSRYRDRAAVVHADRTLRTLLAARNLCNLPVLVVDDEERLVGLVTEREIIHAIIEKRGHNGDTSEVTA